MTLSAPGGYFYAYNECVVGDYCTKHSHFVANFFQYTMLAWENLPNSILLYLKVIGASLSEPHTSGTALQMCVYTTVRPYTVNF